MSKINRSPWMKRLLEKFVCPPQGLGMMHYSSFTPDDVRKAFKKTPASYRARFKLEIPRTAVEITENGRYSTVEQVGCYWQVVEK